MRSTLTVNAPYYLTIVYYDNKDLFNNAVGYNFSRSQPLNCLQFGTVFKTHVTALGFSLINRTINSASVWQQIIMINLIISIVKTRHWINEIIFLSFSLDIAYTPSEKVSNESCKY
jgi:hypothetical protein